MLPSPEVVVTNTEKALLVQVVVLGDRRPAPERFTVSPDSQVPARVSVDW